MCQVVNEIWGGAKCPFSKVNEFYSKKKKKKGNMTELMTEIVQGRKRNRI